MAMWKGIDRDKAEVISKYEKHQQVGDKYNIEDSNIVIGGCFWPGS